MAVNLFAYKKGDSALHKIPALAKIIFLIAFNIFIFWGGNSFFLQGVEINAEISAKEIFSPLLVAQFAGGGLVCVVFFVLGKCGVRTLLSLRYVLFLGILVTIFNLSKDGLIYGALYTARFLLATLLAQIIFETTSPLQIKEAVPIPAVALALNFIPEIFSEWNKIHLAARARSPQRLDKRQNNSRGVAQNEERNLERDAHKNPQRGVCQGGALWNVGRAFIQTPLMEFEALFSNMLYKAETKRKALLNRS